MNMKRFMNKKVVAIGLAAGMTLGAAGAAFAYFTSTGTGNGTATAGSASQWNVSVTGDNTSLNLVPVATSRNRPVRHRELHDHEQRPLVSRIWRRPWSPSARLTPDRSMVRTSAPPPTSRSAGMQLARRLRRRFGVNEAGTSPGPAGSYTNTVSLQLVDNGQNQDQCQGAVVHLKVVAS